MDTACLPDGVRADLSRVTLQLPRVLVAALREWERLDPETRARTANDVRLMASLTESGGRLWTT